MSNFSELLEIGDRFGCREELKNWAKENVLCFTARRTIPTQKLLVHDDEAYNRMKQYSLESCAYGLVKELLSRDSVEINSTHTTEYEESIVTRLYVLHSFPPKDVAAELGMG